MAKRAEDQPRELTRKQIHHNARELERNRKLYVGVGLAIGLAALVITIGLLSEFVFKPNSALASVADQTIVTKDFWKRARLQRSQLINQLVQMQQLEQQFGGQGFFGDQITNQISQIQATLSSPFSLGVQVLDQMINEKVASAAAAERGLAVTDEEIDEVLREQIAAQQEAVTVAQATSTAETAVEATATAESWTPTPTPTIDVNSVVTATSVAPATPEPLPTMPILGDADFQSGLDTLTTNIDRISGLTLAEYREVIRNQLLAEKLAEAIGEEQVQTTEEQVHARHILVRIIEPTPEPTPLPDGAEAEPTEIPTPLPDGAPTPLPTPEPRSDEQAKELAEEFHQRLLAGEDFVKLAAENSEDPSNADRGGDLGWFSRGDMVPTFEDAAFALPIGETSEPIQTQFGYHLIEVLERDENHPKDESTLAQERAQAYQDWLSAQVIATEIERPADLASKLPADLTAVSPVISSSGPTPAAPAGE